MAEAIVKVAVESLGSKIEDVTNRVLWKLLLHEDIDEIRSGNKINEAEHVLQSIETYISYASFILAGGVSNPERFHTWIIEAQNDAFCLEDQIAMYKICGSNLENLISMKKSIGKSSINGLTTRIKNCINNKPDEVQRFESDPSEFMRKLPEISPFIRYSQDEAADRVSGIMDSKINELKKLLSESCNRSVVFIIGEKGSGKTMLMKSLYNDEHFMSSFGSCSWVNDTAKITDLAGLLRKVLKGSVEDHDAISELEIMSRIQGTFCGEGKGRYLIVLDDVEDTCALHTLKHVLRGCKGKIICLTTPENIQGVQDDTDKDSSTLTVGPLEPNDARKLLMHEAFPGFKGDGEFKEAIEWRAKEKNRDHDLPVTDVVKKSKILDNVLKKCMGNPWNIRAVGRLFEAHPFQGWEQIQARIDGLLIGGNRGGVGKLDPPVELEDPRLPLRIWRSFLYCLAFPKGSEISAQKLARLWMAEGFVEDSPLHSQEHEADSLLQKLIERNLLVEKKKGFDGKVLKRSVNEHIRPLALDMCNLQKFCRFMPHEPDNNARPAEPDNARLASPSTNSPTSRYRVLSVRGDVGVKELSDSEMLGKDIRLRSLLYFGTGKMQREELKVSFKRVRNLPLAPRIYRLLRTLELQGARLDSLPSSIECLVCLRYLGLRNTQLEDLPESLDMLTKLLCLDIRDTNITSLYDVSTFREMRHLHLAKSFRGQSVLIGGGLRSLVHLRTLSGAADGGNLERELSHLVFLRKLSIKVSSASSNNICAAVSNMGFLHSLAITVHDDEPAKEKGNTSEGGEPLEEKGNIADGEHEPLEKKQETPDRKRFDIGSLKIGENMRKLKLGGDMGELSAARISMMHSITHLYLWDSKLDSDVLRSLQGLQDLLQLSLCNVSTCSELRCAQGGFRKLKKLSIVSMENLNECILERGAMKNLEELMFAMSGKRTSSVQGLEHILSLKNVYLSEMPTHFVDRVKATATCAQIHVNGMLFHKREEEE